MAGQFVVVELPYLACDERSAFSLLRGGREKVNSVIAHSSLQLKASVSDPTDDHLRQYLNGKRAPVSSFLLSVKRPRNGDSLDSPSSASIAGIIFDSYQFSAVSDLQFLPERVQHRAPDTKDLIARHVQVSASIVEAIPRPFLRPLVNKGPQLNSTMLWGTDLIDAKQNPKPSTVPLLRPRYANNVVVKWGDEIPRSSGGSAGKKWDHTRKQLLGVLNQLFAKRPIWRKRQLESNSEADRAGAAILNEVLPEVAFIYSTGPYKGLWSRFAFDPRLDPSSRYLQVFAVRFNIAVYRQISELLVAHIGRTVLETHFVNLDTMTLDRVQSGDKELGLSRNSASFCVFNTLIREMAQFQICSLADPELFIFVSKALRLPTAGAYGWYSEDTLRYLRARVLQTIFQRVEQFVSRPVVEREDAALPPSLLLKRNAPKESKTQSSVPLQSMGDSIPLTLNNTPAVVLKSVLGFQIDFFEWQDKYFSIPDRAGDPAEISLNCQHLLSLIDPRFREMVNEAPRKATTAVNCGAQAHKRFCVDGRTGEEDFAFPDSAQLETERAIELAMGIAEEEIVAFDNFEDWD